MMDPQQQHTHKQCPGCQISRPLTDFRRRTGRRSSPNSRRGLCRECRQRGTGGNVEHNRTAIQSGHHSPPAQDLSAANSMKHEPSDATVTAENVQVATVMKKPAVPGRPRSQQRRKSALPRFAHDEPGHIPLSISGKREPDPRDTSRLRPNGNGLVRMRGKTDKGRRWQQEIELELAHTLVREHMAVIMNRSTIRRLYSNKEFRNMIMKRDNYTCYYCGKYGDTLDHLLPRARGGHTTPVNCVCACNECNQSKAARDVDEFIESRESSLSEE